MNFLDYNRMRRFMGPSESPFNNVQFQQPEEEDYSSFQNPTQPVRQPGIMGRLADMYNQRGPARDAYASHLAGMPTLADLQPTKIQRILAAVAGGGAGLTQGVGAGINTSQALLRRPYEDKLTDWSNREKALRYSVDDEESTLRNQVAGYRAMADAEIANRREGREELNTNSQISLRQAQINNMKNQGWQFKTDATTGELVGVHPSEGRRSFGKIDQTPEEKGQLEVSLDEKKKKNTFGFDRAMEGIKFGNQTARDRTQFGYNKELEGERAANRQIGDNKRAAMKLVTDKNRVISGSNSERNKAYGVANRMREVFSKNPEISPFFELDEDGFPLRLKTPSESWPAESIETYKSLVESIFGK